MPSAAARTLTGVLIGTLFVLAIVLAYVADLLDRERRIVRVGTGDRSAESLLRISSSDRIP